MESILRNYKLSTIYLSRMGNTIFHFKNDFPERRVPFWNPPTHTLKFKTSKTVNHASSASEVLCALRTQIAPDPHPHFGPST